MQSASQDKLGITTLKELFQDDLYMVKDSAGGEKSATESVNFSNNHLAAILVFYRQNPNPEVAEKHEELLSNILKSVGISIDSVTLLDLEKAPYSTLKQYLAEGEEKTILSFGLLPREMGINANIATYQYVENWGCKLLFSDSLEKLEGDINFKKLLWRGLKQMFQNANA